MQHEHAQEGKDRGRAAPRTAKQDAAPPLHELLGARGNRALQAKLRVSQPDDPAEREAERVAAAVADGASNAVASPAAAPGAGVQRACSSCSQEEEVVSRAAAGQQAPAANFDAGALAAGEPLAPDSRRFFEGRLGHDFGDVRVHRSERAARQADRIDARAFTVGADIGFAAGEYAPETPAGLQLLAHELTHVVQQRSAPAAVQRDEKDGASKSAPGQKNEESIPVTSKTVTKQGTVRYEGQVDRYRTIKTEQGEAREEMGSVNLEFDTETCKVTLPLTIAFERADATNWTACREYDKNLAPDPAQVSESVFQAVRTRYLDEVRIGLKGWYTVELDGCATGCEGKSIPIEVDLKEVSKAQSPDFVVRIAHSNLRSCVHYSASTGKQRSVNLYVTGELPKETARHEGDHMVLAYGDEYREPGEPEGRVVDTDWSRLGAVHTYGNWALLHERHFGFVTAFLHKVLGKDCRASLKEVARPPEHAIVINLSIGTVLTPKSAGFYYGLGIDLAHPLDRLRELQVMGGLHARLLALTDPYDLALVGGFRLGVGLAKEPSAAGMRLGMYGELGLGYFVGGSDLPSVTMGYGELGSSFGYGFGAVPSFGAIPFIMGDAARGGTFAGGDHKAMEWFRVGVSAGLNFYGF